MSIKKDCCNVLKNKSYRYLAIAEFVFYYSYSRRNLHILSIEKAKKNGKMKMKNGI